VLATGATAYFLCPDDQVPSGGIRKIYRFVDILNDAGLRAYVVHAGKGFRCRWFANTTPLLALDEVRLAGDDLLVIPEIYGDRLEAITSGAPHVIFNQGPGYTFSRSGWDRASWSPVTTGSTLGIVTVSEDARAYLEFTFPQIPVWRVRLGLDPDTFYPGPAAEPRPRRIAFMPRRRTRDLAYLLRTADLLGALEGWELAPIAALPEQEVARQLRSSGVFLALGEWEGLGLPPLEAMACGCLVVGFHGGGGREFMLPEFSYPIEESDLLGFARTLVYVLRSWDQQGLFSSMARRASEFTLRACSAEQEARDVVAVFSSALAEVADRSTPAKIRLDSRAVTGEVVVARWRVSGYYAREAARNLGRALGAARRRP
jgi:hypothetical protein